MREWFLEAQEFAGGGLGFRQTLHTPQREARKSGRRLSILSEHSPKTQQPPHSSGVTVQRSAALCFGDIPCSLPTGPEEQKGRGWGGK